MKRYPSVRFPNEAKKGFIKKQEVIEKILRDNKIKVSKKNLSLANTLRFYAQKPIYIYEDEVINFFKKHKRSLKGVQI